MATFWFFASQERLSTNTLARLWEKDNFIPRKCPVARGSKIQEGEEGKEKIKLLNNEYNQAGAGSMFSAGRICTRTDDMQLHNPRGGLRDVMRRERGIEREMITFLSWEAALLLSFVCEIGRGFAAFAAQESVSSLVFFFVNIAKPLKNSVDSTDTKDMGFTNQTIPWILAERGSRLDPCRSTVFGFFESYSSHSSHREETQTEYLKVGPAKAESKLASLAPDLRIPMASQIDEELCAGKCAHRLFEKITLLWTRGFVWNGFCPQISMVKNMWQWFQWWWTMFILGPFPAF